MAQILKAIDTLIFSFNKYGMHIKSQLVQKFAKL